MHFSVECSDWDTYLEDPDCSKLSLLNNLWAKEKMTKSFKNNPLITKYLFKCNWEWGFKYYNVILWLKGGRTH